MTKKIFIIAGEASGDLLGLKLMQEFKSQNPDVKFIGVGGPLMKSQGLKSIFPMEELSIMGFFEILPHLKKLLNRITETANYIIKEQPDAVITIDSPDFCFRVVKKIQKFKNIKKIHLIAPSVWAYRAKRARKIAAIYDLLLAILPFEPPYFEKYGLKTLFIGHPIMQNAPDLTKKQQENALFRQKHQIAPNDKVICLMPGSRNSEVNKIFPEFIAALNLLAKDDNNIKIVIPTIDKTRKIVTKMAQNLSMPYFLIDQKQKESAFFASDFALAKSGTNSVELSLFQIPMLIAYKVNYLSYLMIKSMIKVKFVNLINLIKNREVIPEMIQDKCSANSIYDSLKEMMQNKELCLKQVQESKEALQLMGLNFDQSPSQKAVIAINKIL